MTARKDEWCGVTFWPSTLPHDPLFDVITSRVLAATAERMDKEWSDMSEKPSGVAAAQAAAFFVDIGMQEIVEGFEPKKLPPMEVVGKDTDGNPILRNQWGAYDPWISVDERLPDEGTSVLVWMPDLPHAEHGMDIGSYMTSHWGVSWMVSDGRSAFPTHWMPLPNPPKAKP